MDVIDREIIGELQRDGRISFRDLGAQVGLSPNAAAERVRRLQEDGVIRGFRADVDPVALGFPLLAYVDVKLSMSISDRSFETVAATIPGIIRATLLTGTFDCSLMVACADQEDLVRILEALRERASVIDMNTRVVLRETEIAPLGVQIKGDIEAT